LTGFLIISFILKQNVLKEYILDLSLTEFYFSNFKFPIQQSYLP